jgi:hypothetical protein
MRFLRELCKIACPACPFKNLGMVIFPRFLKVGGKRGKIKTLKKEI